MRTLPRLLALLLVAGATVACEGSSSSSSGVPWKDYSPTVRTRIDTLAATKDCTNLQGEFNTADAGNQMTMNRTGHNNAALMGYIDGKLHAAGC